MFLYALINLLYCLKKNQSQMSLFFKIEKGYKNMKINHSFIV